MNALIFLIVLHCTKRRCSQIEPQLKVKKRIDAKRPKKTK